MSIKVRVAAVIVTYNGENYIDKCIQSLMDSEYDIDIFVLDNNSTDNTISKLKDYSVVNILESQSNLGFGKGNNEILRLLLREHNYDYYLLINQDAYIYPDTLVKLLKFGFENSDYGILSPMHYNIDGNLDFNFKDYLNKRAKRISEKLYEAQFVNAAIWLVSKACLSKVGLFNPYFQHYGEDNNYCSRVIYNKLKIGIICDAKAVHDRKENLSFDKIILLSKIKLETLFLDLNIANYKVVAIRHVFGLPKYYFGKKLSLFKSIKLFYCLCSHYFRLSFSKKITTIREEQLLKTYI